MSATRVPRRPYLLRAMHQWMTDSGFTPHVIVSAEVEDAQLPRAYARDGKIVDFEVMVRPLSGLQALGEEMGKRLAPYLAAFKGATPAA